MKKPLLCACFVLAILPRQARAQFTDPRTYNNSPVGINQLELNYARVHANASIDTSLIITGAKIDLNQGIIDYTRYFGLLRRLTWVEAGVPIAGLGGSVAGTNIQGSIVGAGDSSYAAGILLKGGSALSLAEFEKCRPTTTLGVSLTITAPTGSYNANKILNLGSGRWSFKPEFAAAHPFGSEQQWEIEAYANVYFYTNNTSYHGREILRQEALPGLEGHLSYSFNDRLWTSLDTRYSFRGATAVNGVDQNNPQRNFILGTEMNISLNARNSLVLEFGKALVHRNGPSVVGFSVKYDYTWGSAYR
jgi:Putative MetA-pathway of phenol degradation